MGESWRCERWQIRGFNQILKKAELFHKPLRLNLAYLERQGSNGAKTDAHLKTASKPRAPIGIITILHQFRGQGTLILKDLSCLKRIIKINFEFRWVSLDESIDRTGMRANAVFSMVLEPKLKHFLLPFVKSLFTSCSE